MLRLGGDPQLDSAWIRSAQRVALRLPAVAVARMGPKHRRTGGAGGGEDFAWLRAPTSTRTFWESRILGGEPRRISCIKTSGMRVPGSQRQHRASRSRAEARQRRFRESG